MAIVLLCLVVIKMVDLKYADFIEVKDIQNNWELELFLLWFYYHELWQEKTFVTTWSLPTWRINIYEIYYDFWVSIKKIDKWIYNHVDDSVIKSFVRYNSNEFCKNEDFEYIPDKEERVKNDCTRYASYWSYIKNYNPIFFECFTWWNSFLLFMISENDSKYKIAYKKIKEKNNIKYHSLWRYWEMLNEVQPLLEKYKEYNSLDWFEWLKTIDDLNWIYLYIKEIVKEITGNDLECWYLSVN